MKILIENWNGNSWVSEGTVNSNPASVVLPDSDMPLTDEELQVWSDDRGPVTFEGKKVMFVDSPEAWIEGYLKRAKTSSRVRATLVD